MCGKGHLHVNIGAKFGCQNVRNCHRCLDAEIVISNCLLNDPLEIDGNLGACPNCLTQSKNNQLSVCMCFLLPSSRFSFLV